MATLTIRNVPDALLSRLRAAKEQQGESINTLVVRTLVAVFGGGEHERDLSRYTTWTQEDYDEFMEALHEQRVIDDDLWS